MKKKKKRKKFLGFTVFLVLFATLSCSLYFSSNRIMVELAQSSFSSMISSASYYAIDKIIDAGYDYKSLVDVKTDGNGDISMVITDSFTVNSLANTAAENAYNYLDEQTKKGVSVPMGAFTGFMLISGFGKPIQMRLISVHSVKCEIISDFTQAGINQTRHSLYFNIFCDVSIITKTSTKKVTDKISVLVYDNLIIGKVPSVLVTSQIIGQGSENI